MEDRWKTPISPQFRRFTPRPPGRCAGPVAPNPQHGAGARRKPSQSGLASAYSRLTRMVKPAEDMIEPDLRKLILAKPERLLDDRDVMNALAAANDRGQGANVVDLRAIAMQRLENRLENLEDTHRSVIAAAYENLAGTNQVHRAVLRLLEAPDFTAFLLALGDDVAMILRVDAIRLVLESAQEKAPLPPALRRLGYVLQVAPRDFVQTYMTGGKRVASRPVVLRRTTPLSASVYGPQTEDLRSEAVLRLDLGADRLPALLAFGSEDPNQFKSAHGTDLLAFFAGAFERQMRRWLA